MTNSFDPPRSVLPLAVDQPEPAMLSMFERYATADFESEEVQAGILQIVCQQLGWDYAALVMRPMDDPGQLYWQFTGEKGAWEKPGVIDGLNQLARRAMAERKLV